MTCQDTFAPSYSAHTTREAGAVAALAEERRVVKYVNLTPEHLFSPIAVETMGVLGPHTKMLLRDLGRWVTQTTEEKRATTYLVPEAVSGSAAGQLCLSDGHHRPTRFWSFLLAKLPTQNAVGLILV